MKLPNPNQTYINDSKLIGYSLNFNHADGQHKARVFKSALGITKEDLQTLKKCLMQAVLNNEAIPDKINQYGKSILLIL